MHSSHKQQLMHMINQTSAVCPVCIASTVLGQRWLWDTGSAVPKHQEWEAELAKELAMQRSQHRHMGVIS